MTAIKAGILAAILWAVILTGIFYVHVEVLLKGRISKERDEAMSLAYGRLTGFGIVPAAVVAYVLKARSDRGR